MKSLFLVLILAAAGSHAGAAHRLGLEAGFPQMGAVAYQYTPGSLLSYEAYLGTMIINATCGGRVILSRTENGFHPRCFLGFALVNALLGETADCPMGTTGYFWTGGGLSYYFASGVTVFADLGYIGGGDRGKGLGYNTGPVLSGGLLFRL